jgi:hypothetical protein
MVMTSDNVITPFGDQYFAGFEQEVRAAFRGEYGSSTCSTLVFPHHAGRVVLQIEDCEFQDRFTRLPYPAQCQTVNVLRMLALTYSNAEINGVEFEWSEGTLRRFALALVQEPQSEQKPYHTYTITISPM